MIPDDRISDLPDEILCHILSFLPTKPAFTTTVLSKRWTPLFFSRPILDFNYNDFYNYNAFSRFCRFVNNLMLSSRYSTNKPFKTFRLKIFGVSGDRDQISRILSPWLEAAKQRRVEEFHLILYCNILKPNIFISPNLVVLKLEWLKIASGTSCVYLPSLKTLHLKFVEFKNRNDYINFLSACPILLDLHATDIRIRSEMNLDVNKVPQEEELRSLFLSKLVRASISSMDALFNGICNVEFLRITRTYKEASFKVLPVFSNLIHIVLVFDYRSFHCRDGVVEILRHCLKLQILFIKKVC
jgi:hypothetical protein